MTLYYLWIEYGWLYFLKYCGYTMPIPDKIEFVQQGTIRKKAVSTSNLIKGLLGSLNSEVSTVQQ